jgi:hypothetical protein
VRRRTAALLTCLLLAACSSGSNEESTHRPSAQSTRCTAVRTLADYERVQLDAHRILRLSDARVRSAYVERRRLTERLASVVDDRQLQASIEETLRLRAIYEPFILDQLHDNHDEMERVGMSWPLLAIATVGASDEQRSAFARGRPAPWEARIRVECDAPELAHLPAEDRTGRAETGTIVYDSLGSAPGLLAVPSTGGTPRPLSMPAGWDDLSHPAVATDGRTIAALAGSREGTGIAVGTLNGPFRVIHVLPSGTTADCVEWDRSTGDVLATVRAPDYSTTHIRIHRDGSAENVTLGVGHVDCVSGTDDGRLLLDGATDDVDDFGAVGLAESDGTGFRKEYGSEDCHVLARRVAPDRPVAAAFQTCLAPRSNGLVLLDLASGERTHPVTGSVAVPSWSPKGDWLVFGLAPIGTDPVKTTRLYLVRPDGSGLRRLTDAPSSFPAWVTDELAA